MTRDALIVVEVTQFDVPSFPLVIAGNDFFVVYMAWLLLNVVGMTQVSYFVDGDSPDATIAVQNSRNERADFQLVSPMPAWTLFTV